MTEEQAVLLGVVVLGMDPLKLEAALCYERERMRRAPGKFHEKHEQDSDPGRCQLNPYNTRR